MTELRVPKVLGDWSPARNTV